MKGGKIQRDSAVDIFSNLPSNVVEQILSLLPIRDAVRTSVLSTEWRFKWTTMPALVFNKDFFSFTPEDDTIIKKKLVNLIDYALLLHTGPVSKFKLYQRHPITASDIDRWILHLSRCHPVQELILDIWEGQRYKVNSCLFSFQDLVHLELLDCHIKLPSTFGGFKKLKRLDIQWLTVAQDDFETLISSCPILESLTSIKVDGFTHLNIDAPNLLNINFIGYFDDINLVNTSNLATACIDLVANDATDGRKVQDSSNLLKFLSSLPRIKQLKIVGDFLLEYLATGDLHGQLPNPCLDLSYLKVDITIDEYAQCSAVLCLLKSSPNLEKLEVKVRMTLKAAEFQFWENEHKNFSFNKLQTVDISGISGNKNELEFIRFMLLASPVLKKMTIKRSLESEALELATELLMFQRASTKAVLVFVKSEVAT